MRAYRACDSWHVFVFIADRDHVVFRRTREHTSDTVAKLVGGFRGYLLSDAAPVYDVLHRGGEIVEVAYWTGGNKRSTGTLPHFDRNTRETGGFVCRSERPIVA